MRTFASQQDAVTAINAGELKADDRFLIGTREYRMIDDVWMTEVLESEKPLKVDQFDTDTAGEQRGQFDSHQAAWSWGKNDGVFWAEVLEYFDDSEELNTERFEAKSMKSLLRAVAGETASAWTSAVITHDNGKKRTVKL